MSAKFNSQYFDRLRQLTTRWGIYQHSHLTTPDPQFGYALDDQVRAYLLVNHFGLVDLSDIYLNFLHQALTPAGSFHYFYDDGEKLIPNRSIPASEDALGLVGWALISTQHYPNIVDHILSQAKSWQSLRAVAYLILGLTENPSSPVEELLIQKIRQSFTADPDWLWFESTLTYGNALLPWALWQSGRLRHDQNSLDIAKTSTDFLIKTCQINGVVAPIGCHGWYPRGGLKSQYDQQPIDAAYMIGCLHAAYLATQDQHYLTEIKKWWAWFWGRNSRLAPLVDNHGACFDGLTNKPDKVNLNQGAESAISFLLAYWYVHDLISDSV